MKKIIKLISLICAVSLIAGCSLVTKVEKEPKEKKSVTVVTVDGVEYSLERFNLCYYNAQDEILTAAGYTESTNIPDDFWSQKVDGKTNLQRAKEQALSELIDDAVAYQKAKKLGVKLTAEEKSQISNQMSSLRQDKMTLEQFNNIGISQKEFEKYFTESIYISHLVPELVKKGEIKVDEAEALKQFKDDYVKAKHILISTINPTTQQPLSDSEVKKAEAKARDILNKIKSGEDFDKLMKENNEDPGMESSPDGYVFTAGQMVPEFEVASFALSENQVSEIVQTDYGFHIIKRIPFDMNGSQEISALDSVKSEMAMPEFETARKEWKAKAEIKIEQKIIDDLKPSIVKN